MQCRRRLSGCRVSWRIQSATPPLFQVDRPFEATCERWKVGHDFVNFCADGWVLPIVSHANYYVKFDGYVDWRQLTMKWSETYWLENHTTTDAESVLLRFPYYGYRYRYKVQGGTTGDNFDWLPGTVAGERYVDETGSSRGVTRLSKWGKSQIFQQDDSLNTNFPGGQGEVRIAVNPINSAGLAPEVSLRALRVNCNPLMCRSLCESPANTPLSPPMKWSRGTTWQAVRLASYNGDPSEGVSSLKFKQSMTWQTQEAGANVLPPDGVDLEIPAGIRVRLDTSTAKLNVLVVVGRLDFDVTATGDVDLAVEQLIVFGALHVGTEDFPWPSNFVASITVRGNLISSSDVKVSEVHDLGNKVIAVFGDLQLHGALRAAKTWEALETTAGVGDTELMLASAVGWELGSTIIITSTEYTRESSDPVFESQHRQEETRRITSVSGKFLTLDRPLEHRHFAGAINGTNGLTLAAHVGLISRSIVVSGHIDPNYFIKQYGLHITVSHVTYPPTDQCKQLTLTGSMQAVGVEFRDMVSSAVQLRR